MEAVARERPRVVSERLVMILPMEPYGKKAPRPGTIKVKGKVRGTSYDHPENRSKKAEARHHIARHLDGNAIPFPSTPVAVSVIAMFSCPKSDHRKRTPRPRRPHAKRPDEDNVSKWIKDAMTGLVYTDDSQVADCSTKKIIAAQGERPRVIVAVEPLDDDYVAAVGRLIERYEGTEAESE